MIEDIRLFKESPTKEEAEEMATPKGMRNQIKRHTLHSPIVRAVFVQAEAKGLDELDTMTLLAFHSVSMLESTQAELLRLVRSSPAMVYPTSVP